MKLIGARGRELQHIEFSALVDSLILEDGTIWSHAATLGTRNKGGSEFTIDKAAVENFIKVFTTGYPQKIPVDYNHASTTSDPIAVGLGYQGQAPKAGDVRELRGVFNVSDFDGDLKAAAEALAKKAERPLDDKRNFGLWMRWKPTGRALSGIKAEEYTELSIAFDDDLPHNVTGEGQGPGLWAVALLNTPFLDDMLPVAATRGETTRGDPASTENHMTTNNTSNTKLLSLVAAVRGKPVATDDEAISELTAHQTEVTELRASREFHNVIAAEFEDEKDPVKVVAKVRELKASVKTAQDAAAAQKKAAIKTTVEATMEKHKNKLTVPMRELMSERLTAELDAGAKPEDTKTVKALESMKSLGIFTQDSAGDIGGAGTGDDVKIDARAKELMSTDPELKQLAARDWSSAYKRASQTAARELQLV